MTIHVTEHLKNQNLGQCGTRKMMLCKNSCMVFTNLLLEFPYYYILLHFSNVLSVHIAGL